MPFLAEEHIAIPNNDLLSWMFDEQNYDLDTPVRFHRSRHIPLLLILTRTDLH